MATYYCRLSGSDSNNGTSPATAWRTLSKVLGASGISSGDTVYIGAGTYRETVTVAMTSATSETRIIGDVTGEYTGDAGEVIWSAYTAGDFAAPGTTTLCDLAGRDYLTFQNLTFIGANATTAIIAAATTTSTDCRFLNCTFLTARSGAASGALIAVTAAASTALNWTFDGCRFFSAMIALQVTATTSASGADYDLNVVVTNCSFLMATNVAISVGASGTATYKGNGVYVSNCSGFVVRILDVGVNASTTYPSVVRNCSLITQGAVLVANTAGQITDSGGNRFCNYASGTVTNVTTHATTRFGGFPNIFPLELGQSAVFGTPYRHPLMPYATNQSYPGGALGFGNVSGGTTTSITGRSRPGGIGVLGDSGTATGGSSTTLVDSGKSWGTDVWKGWLVRTGSQVKRIRTNTATTLTTAGGAPAGGNWATNPANGDAYVIYQGPQVETGKATAGAATTLTDSGAAWATNQWAGYTLEITGGTGSGQTATITSNTATVITVPTWGTNPDSTSTYSLYWPGGSTTATQSSAGAFELGDTAKRVTAETGDGIQIDGPGTQDLTLPVSGASTTVTVRVLFDGNHGTGSKPQAQILAQGELGVSLTTATATGSADTWETLTLSFTPTAAGVVTLRLVSRSATPYGYARFDTIEVS